MATLLDRRPRRRPLAPDTYERVLAIGAIILLVAVAMALVRGHAEWGQVPLGVWLHLATILLALVLTPIMLLRPRGDRLHRRLGRVWVAAMTLTALLSLGVHEINPGHFSIIHLLSLYVVVMAPVIWWSAARHKLELHRGSVRGMVTGSLLVAGFFTFPFHRLLGHWLFG